MRLDGKPADLSGVAALLWLPLGWAGACMLLFAIWSVVNLMPHWQEIERRHAVMVSIFFLLGGFGLAISIRWYRRLYVVDRKKGGGSQAEHRASP